MALTEIIRFKVAPKLHARAKRIVRLRNAKAANPLTLSDIGREWFGERLLEEERALGLAPAEEQTNGKVAA